MPYLLHALSMGVLAAYDMYNECCYGDLDPDWKIPQKKRMCFAVFRQQLSKQMLEYDPSKLTYMGNEMSRLVTHKLIRRGKKLVVQDSNATETKRVTTMNEE